MADIDYPSALRGAIQSTKQTQKAAGFREAEPAGGPSYTQAFTDNQPTVVSFNLVFKASEAMYFDAWQRQNEIFAQGLFFNMPIVDQYGTTEQEVRFLTSGRPTESATGLITSYTGCQVLIPNYIQPDAETVTSFFETYGLNSDGELEALDILVNQNWPS